MIQNRNIEATSLFRQGIQIVSRNLSENHYKYGQFIQKLGEIAR